MSETRVYANTFQVFNSYVDRAMEHVTDSELRVLIFATRHIMGWQDRIQSRTAAMSLNMFVEGFTVIQDDGTATHYGGCGLGRNAASKALNSLEKFKLLERIGYADERGQEWRLAESPDWKALEERSAAKTDADKRRIAKASAANGSTVARYDESGIDVPSYGMTVVPSDDTRVVPCDGLNQTHIQTHNKKDNGAGQIAPRVLSEVPETETAAVKANSPPTPPSSAQPPASPDAFQQLFGGVAEHIFGITSPDELRALGESEGATGRIGMIASWLAKKNDRFTLGNGSRKKTVIGFISAPADPKHLPMFAGWYKNAHRGASLPRDVVKFVEYWREWASTRKPKPARVVEPTVQRDRRPPTADEIAEMRRLRQQTAATGARS